MVGPRSKGCRTCVKRRIRCDGSRPVCSRCTKAGYDCPGYNKAIQFLDPVTGLIESSTSTSSSCTPKDEGGPSTQRPALPEVSLIQRGARRGDSLWYQDPPNKDLAVAYSGLLRSSPIIELSDPQLFDAFIVDLKPNFIWTRSWFREINDIRHDQTYNDAFRALARIHCAKASGDPALLSHGRFAYGRSLNGLRKKIETWVGTDVAFLQNIVIVLSVYEFYDACLSNKSGQITLQNVEASNYRRENWIHHAKAIATIMKILGPGPYMKDPAVEFAFVVMRDTMAGVFQSGERMGTNAETDYACVRKRDELLLGRAKMASSDQTGSQHWHRLLYLGDAAGSRSRTTSLARSRYPEKGIVARSCGDSQTLQEGV